MIHTVQQGECLSTIARRNGFGSWKILYDHPNNADLRKARKHPNILYPGDEVFIPDPKPKQVGVATGAAHKFVAKRERPRLRLRIQTPHGTAQEGARYVLSFEGGEESGSVGANGLIEHRSLPGSSGLT